MRLAGVMAAGVVLIGCEGADEATLEVATEESSATEGDDDGNDETEAPNEGEDDVAPEEAEESSTPEPGDAGDDEAGRDTRRDGAWPDPIELDVVERHSGGLVMELFELRASATSIDLDVRVTNGADIPADLTGPLDPTVLIDDLGTEYLIVPPEGDLLMQVGAGEVMEGTLAFVGPLAPEATSLELLVNPGTQDEDWAPSPRLEIGGLSLTTDETG